MSDSHDNGAAAKAQRFLDAWCEEPEGGDGPREVIQSARGHVRYPTLTVAVLRAVLAENETMRKQLAGLRTQKAVLWHRAEDDCWIPTGFTTVAEAIAEEGGQLQWREGSRLVGEWQPAEGDDDVQR